MMTKDEALRLALEALELAHPRFGIATEKHKQAITAIKKASLEAKDEPVAWRDAAIRLGEELSSVGPDGYYDMDAKEWLDWAMEQNPRGKHSLPQRKPLTDEEIQQIFIANSVVVDNGNAYMVAGLRTVNIARAIEAAHGIKEKKI